MLVISVLLPTVSVSSASSGKPRRLPPQFFLNRLSYPTDNCFALYGPDAGTFHDPQEIFSNYTSHDQVQSLVNNYYISTQLAIGANKPFIMFETNTASCGGFPGISDSFGATLWALDYGLNMAAGNFSEALFHVGGQDTYYNVRNWNLGFSTC